MTRTMTSDNSFTSHSSSDRPRLSVVIPACNEEQGIGQTLDQLTRAGVWEIIVADGGSTDRTAEVCRTYGAKVVGSPPGRGQQLNSGAAAATGDVLLFLHADTTLPRGLTAIFSWCFQLPTWWLARSRCGSARQI